MRAALLPYLAFLACLGLLGCKDTKFDKDGKPITVGSLRIRTFPKGARRLDRREDEDRVHTGHADHGGR